MKISLTLEQNVKRLKKRLRSDDVAFSEIRAGSSPAVLVYVKDLVDKEKMGDLILRPLTETDRADFDTLDACFLSPEKQTSDSLDQTVSQIVCGDAALFVDGVDKSFIFGIRKFEKRAITEPPTSTVIKGPREGFVESVPVNVSLMRRRIK